MSTPSSPPVRVLQILHALVFEENGDARATALHEGPALRARSGQEIFAEGDPSDTVFILVEGQVALTVATPGGEPAERNTLLLRAPALFGDRDVLSENGCLEGARCLVPARLLALDAADFRAEWAADPELRKVLARDLARRYTAAILLQRLQELPLPSRLPLLQAAAPREWPPLTPAMLALLANATSKSISRALAVQPGNAESESGSASASASASAQTTDALGPYLDRLFHCCSRALWDERTEAVL
jgi:CRP-like cAMP-binding protein